jgi:arsenical pump membrane protein
MDALKIVVTVGIFAGTLTLVLWKPRGWSEACWPVLGAVAMMALRLVTPAQALDMVWASRNALLFLLALLLLSALVEVSGFFEWAALHAGRSARGDGRRLFRNVFALGAVVTVVLSLDTTAVMLTPIVVGFVKRLRLSARPFIIASAFVANIASLLLPISNLTNLLFADAFDIPFGRFALRMAAPQLVALVAAYLLLRWRFRAELPASFDAADLAEPSTVVPDRCYFRVVVVVLGAVLVGYFIAPSLRVEPYMIGFAGIGVLGAVGIGRHRVGMPVVREISWGLFPLVIGLFVVVRAVENIGIVATAAGWVAAAPRHSLVRALVASASAGAASNLMNNLPAALVARSVLHGAGADRSGVFGALIGLDIGPTILPTGSLATLIVLDVARKRGEAVSAFELTKIGLWLTPIVLVLATIAFAACSD